MVQKTFSDKQLYYVQAAVAIIFCCIPLFITFPYKINLYLAWEGAYRIAEGQVPFRDFGMPLGYGFWILPALFFKIFGPFMSTLIKTQVIINMISIVALDRIWRTLNISQAVRTIGTTIFCITFVFIHFWPWYNHTVYVYEWISIAFLLGAFKSGGRKEIFFAGAAGVFAFLSIFTKQDIGVLGVFLSIALIIGDFFFRRKFRPGLIYLLTLFIFGCLVIWPLTAFDFGYWYNFGQEPHSTRISMIDYLDELFHGRSLIYRVYFLVMALAAIYLFKRKLERDSAYNYTMIFLLCLGSIVQSLLSGVTSYVPISSHYYYHTFFFVFILHVFDDWVLELRYRWLTVSMIILVFFIWSSDPWRYSRRLLNRIIPQEEQSLDKVNRNTYIIKRDTLDTDRSDWIPARYESLDNVRMPRGTLEGLNWIIDNYGDNESLRMLNMSELPHLYYEMDLDLPQGRDFPLWYHRNVAFFEREQNKFCADIEAGKYDLVLFEVIPNLNGFYPPEVRECLQSQYQLVKTFKAPRIPENATIEVYERLD